ncbi:MAG: phosphoribosylformylglycinamidine synthase subunit PurL [Pseudomonadota bacterium]
MTLNPPIAITPDLIAAHGLTAEEYERFRGLLSGREPTFTELGIVSAMWNEHCSYKSSKKWLKTLPTEGERVIEGPGENAGVVDIGDGQAVVFKMESHNHPSYIEPYQGAATGVGGILRDVFTMGARPIAAMNALRFGAPDHPKTRHLVSGVVAGIGGYGNAFGVPTVGGEVEFHRRYNGNCLVNAFAAGIAQTDAIFRSEARGVGLPVVYLGAKTGRDGVGGATMASAEFDDTIDEKRPTVQVGDPFTEKCLLEACLELMGTGAVIAIQDMGAAGLTCSAVEMGAKGDLGIRLDLDKVPCREEDMSAYEMMLSESQERMLMVLEPAKRAQAEAVFNKWALDFAVVGETTDTLRFEVFHEGSLVADLPIKDLGDQAPEYDRPWVAPAKPAPALDIDRSGDVADGLLKLLASPEGASKRWVYEQYDTLVRGQTIATPGGDAGIVRVTGDGKCLAFSSDVTPRYVEADPFEGAKQAVAEVWRNLTAVGSLPLAATDNLNFGNPEKPEIMGGFVRAIEGLGEACRELDFPIVSGNVSLYNETDGSGILPTPTIAGAGLIRAGNPVATLALRRDGDVLALVGPKAASLGHLGQSAYLRDVLGREDGAPPPVDLAAEKNVGDCVRRLIGDGLVDTVHDVSSGGLALCIAEMAITGGIGATITPPEADAIGFFFGEDQARYVIAFSPDRTAQIESVVGETETVALTPLGSTGGDELKLGNSRSISIGTLRSEHERWFPNFMTQSPL